MPGDRGTERGHVLAATGIGVLLRVSAAAFVGNGVEAQMPGVADQLSYHTLALRVLDGHGFSFATGWWPATPAGAPTAHWSYLYTGFLCTIYAAFGPNPLAARLLQALMTGVLHPYLTWRIGRRLGGARVGRYAAYGAASYPYFVYYGAALMTEALYFVAILWTIQLALDLGDDREASGPSWRRWFAFGVAAAATGLLRQVFLLCLPIIWLWIAARRVARSGPGPLGPVARPLAIGTATAATVAVLCLSPVTVRNYHAFGRFVPVNTNAGFALFWGNHPVHGRTFMPLLPGDGSRYGALIPDDLRRLNEAELDQALLRRGLQFIIDDPVRYLQLTGGRIAEYFKFWPSADSGMASNVIRVIGFGVLVPLALLGIVMVARQTDLGPSGAADRAGSLLLLTVAATYTMLHVLVWALVRYRLPVDALIVPFAAVSVTWLADRVRWAGWLPRSHAPIPLT